MSILSIISIGLAISVGLGTAFGIAYAYFNKNNTSSSVEVINLLQKQIDVYRDQLKTKEESHSAEVKEIRAEFTKQVTELTEKVGRLQGQYDAEKTQKEKYELILKDRNPETEAFMKMVTSSCENQVKVNEKLIDALGQMSTVLKEIHTMQKAEHDRDFKIETKVTKT